MRGACLLSYVFRTTVVNTPTTYDSPAHFVNCWVQDNCWRIDASAPGATIGEHTVPISAKALKALDTLIAALEEVKEVLETETSKSRGDADDADSGEVSRSRSKAKPASVPAKGKKSRPDPDDADDLDDGDVDADADDDDEFTDPEEAPVKPAKGKKPAPAAAKKAAGKKAKPAADDDDDDSDSLAGVKRRLTSINNHKELGMPFVKKVLSRFGAERSADLDESDYGSVSAAADKMLASVE